MSGLSTLYSRLLQDLQTGDDAARDIAASALPAHLPGVHLASALGGVAGASCYHAFTTGAFDANTLRQFAAGIALSADDRDENERKRNGGMTQAERTMAMLDAQEEYLQEWMKGSSTIAGLTLSNAEHHELATRLKNDEQFRTLVITQMLQQNAHLSKEQAENGISGYTELVGLYQKHPSQRSDADNARIAELEQKPEVRAAAETSQKLNAAVGDNLNQNYVQDTMNRPADTYADAYAEMLAIESIPISQRTEAQNQQRADLLQDSSLEKYNHLPTSTQMPSQIQNMESLMQDEIVKAAAKTAAEFATQSNQMNEIEVKPATKLSANLTI